MLVQSCEDVSQVLDLEDEVQALHWKRSLCTELERKTLAGRLKAALFAWPCTAACSRLASGGTVISILSDVIQLASRLVAVTFLELFELSVLNIHIPHCCTPLFLQPHTG